MIMNTNKRFGLDVAFIEIQNPLALHIFEACCTMELDTGTDVGGWKTFRLKKGRPSRV